MKIITIIYIFFLYVLFTPGFLMKTKFNMETYLLHALLFSVVFFFSVKIVDGNKENYEGEMSLNMSGMNNLVDLIKSHKKDQEMNIDIENQVKGADNAGAKCWNALGKTQKDIELLRVQLDSYQGNWETIQKLNQTIIQYKDKIAVLKTQLGAYENAENNIDQLNMHLDQYKAQLDALQKQVAAFSGTETDLSNLKATYDKFLSEKGSLTSKLSFCNGLTPGKSSDVVTLNSTVTNNRTTLDNLQTKFNGKKYCPPPPPPPPPESPPPPPPPQTQTVHGNNGTVSMNEYCGGTYGHAWNYELPNDWNGATCISTNYGDCNTVPMNEFGMFYGWPAQRALKPFIGVCQETGDGWQEAHLS
jgi:uncharacterized coiled-coil protein SlyX